MPNLNDQRRCEECGGKLPQFSRHTACRRCRPNAASDKGRPLDASELERAASRLTSSEESIDEIANVFGTTREMMAAQFGAKRWGEIVACRQAMRSPDTGVAPLPWRYAGRPKIRENKEAKR